MSINQSDESKINETTSTETEQPVINQLNKTNIKERENTLLKELKTIPTKQYKENFERYKELNTLYPENQNYTRKKQYYYEKMNGIVLNSKLFIKNNKPIKENEVIALLGNPKEIDSWVFTSSFGGKYPIKTLTYGNYDYHFNNDYLIRISSIDVNIPYNTKTDFLKIFNLNTSAHSIALDTNVAYRVGDFRSGIYDFWILYDSDTKVINTVRLSYTDLLSK